MEKTDKEKDENKLLFWKKGKPGFFVGVTIFLLVSAVILPNTGLDKYLEMWPFFIAMMVITLILMLAIAEGRMIDDDHKDQ